MKFATVQTAAGPRAAVVDHDHADLFDAVITVLDLVRLGRDEAVRLNREFVADGRASQALITG